MTPDNLMFVFWSQAAPRIPALIALGILGFVALWRLRTRPRSAWLMLAIVAILVFRDVGLPFTLCAAAVLGILTPASATVSVVFTVDRFACCALTTLAWLLAVRGLFGDQPFAATTAGNSDS